MVLSHIGTIAPAAVAWARPGPRRNDKPVISGLALNRAPEQRRRPTVKGERVAQPAEAFSLEDAVDPESPLTAQEQQMLAVERAWWKYAGAKEQAIRELFGLSATRYYQILNALIDTEEALAHDPMLVKRLRRLRTTRQRARSARRLGTDA